MIGFSEIFYRYQCSLNPVKGFTKPDKRFPQSRRVLAEMYMTIARMTKRTKLPMRRA